MKVRRDKDAMTTRESVEYDLSDAQDNAAWKTWLNDNQPAPIPDFLKRVEAWATERLVKKGWPQALTGAHIEREAGPLSPDAYQVRMLREVRRARSAIEAGATDEIFRAAFELGALTRELNMRRAHLRNAKTGKKQNTTLDTRRKNANRKSQKARDGRQAKALEIAAKTKLTGGAREAYVQKRLAALDPPINVDVRTVRRYLEEK